MKKPNPKNPIPESSIAWMPRAVWGPLLWKQLAARALAHLPMEGEKEWFDSFVQSIPCPHCQSHFQLYISKNPPDFSSRPAFFVWQTEAHNFVNRAKRKPELTLAQALAVHSDMWLDDAKDGYPSSLT